MLDRIKRRVDRVKDKLHRLTESPERTTPTRRRSKSTAWSGLKKLINVLNKSADTFGPLKAAISELSKCIEIYENRVEARKEYAQLQADLNNLCRSISEYLGGATPPSMTPCFNILVRGIESEINVVVQKLERNGGQSYAEATEDADEILGCYHRIQALLNQLSKLNANMSIWKIVDEEATRGRLSSLPNSPAAEYSSTQSESLGRNGCAPNTRVDVLKQINRWAQGRESQKIYWLNGMAGTGKTTIAYSLCERLKQDGRLAASFFCSRQLPECRNVGVIIPSIAYQLSMFSHPFRYALSHTLEMHPGMHNQPVSQQFESLIVAPLKKVVKSLPADLVIVIDALDECEDVSGVGKLLFALLKHAVGLPAKIFVTSRPDSQILHHMRSELGERVQHELRLHEVDPSVARSDIKIYLTTELKGLNLPDAELHKLAEQSGVLFVYAATIVRYVKHDNFARSETRLEQVLGASTSSNQTHRRVDQLYNTILEAAIQDRDLDDLEREEIKRVLHTVICAQEPLSVSVIARLLGLGVKAVYAALRPLLSVLQVASTTALVTTFHQSFPDYILDAERSDEFHCDAGRHHAWFARTCFDQIEAVKPLFNICDLDSSYVPDEDVHDLDDKIRSAIPQHLFYACQYWEAHTELMERSCKGTDRLFQFLSKRLLLWMEIMNLKKSMHIAVGTLSKLNTWLPRTLSSNETQELALDALKFITAYASSPTRQFTPHIYLSVLALWPKERPIFSHYSKNLTGRIQATGAAIQRREAATLAIINAPGHVYCAEFSPDGAYIISGGSDEVIYIWDAHTGQRVGQPLEGHTGSVRSVAYSPSGARIVSGSDDGTVAIWDAQARKLVGQPLTGHGGPVRSVAYSSDGKHIASGSEDHTVRIWDARTGLMLGQPLEAHSDAVYSVAFSSDNTLIVSGSRDKNICVWNVSTGEMLGEPLQGHKNAVNSVAYSSDGTHIVSGSRDRTIGIWDALTRQLLHQPQSGPKNPSDPLFDLFPTNVKPVACSPDGKCIISTSDHKAIGIWDAQTGQMLGQPLKGHTDWIQSIKYSHDGTRIVSSSNDRTIRIWDANAGQILLGQTFDGHAKSIHCVAYSPDGMHIVSGSKDNSICIWDAHTGQMVGQPLTGHGGVVDSVAYSPDGKYIASGSRDKTIRLWDTRSGKTVGEPLKGHTDAVSSVSYSPDGARIASGSWDNTVCIWDANTSQMMGRPFRGHSNSVYSVAYSPDSIHIISGSADKTIRIWDAGTGQMLGQPLSGHTGWVRSVAYSPDGKHIISCSGDRTVRVWDRRTGNMLGQPLKGHAHWVWSVACSPDGNYMASSSVDKTIRIWDVRSGKMLGQPLEGHTGWVNSVAYSPDGTSIVSGSDDGTIRVWDATTLQLIGELSQSYKGLKHQYLRTSKNLNFVSSSSSLNICVHEPERTVGSPTVPSLDIDAWTLSEDGWVLSHDLNPLLWVPPELQNTLLRYGNTCLISRQGSWKLDITQAKFGMEWKNCYCP